MTDHVQAYPLQWPLGVPRTPVSERRWARFSTRRRSSHAQDLTVSDAVSRLAEAVRLYGDRIDPETVIVSSNLQTGLSGRPLSKQRTIEDPGIAVYFEFEREPRCIAADRYDRPADNLAAVAAILEAMRAIERHGTESTIRQAFTGFAQLEHVEASWRETLHNPRSLAEAEKTFRSLAQRCHPDRGGTDQQLRDLYQARRQARTYFAEKETEK